MRSNVWPVWAGIGIVASCLGGCSSNAPPGGDEGAIRIALEAVPTNVACLTITVDGARHVAKGFDVTAGDSSVIQMSGLPVGTVQIAGTAFSQACASVSSNTAATWVSDPASLTIQPGVVAQVTLHMRSNGRATISVDFSDSDGVAGAGGGSGGAGGNRADAGVTDGGRAEGGASGGTGGSVRAGPVVTRIDRSGNTVLVTFSEPLAPESVSPHTAFIERGWNGTFDNLIQIVLPAPVSLVASNQIAFDLTGIDLPADVYRLVLFGGQNTTTPTLLFSYSDVLRDNGEGVSPAGPEVGGAELDFGAWDPSFSFPLATVGTGFTLFDGSAGTYVFDATNSPDFAAVAGYLTDGMPQLVGFRLKAGAKGGAVQTGVPETGWLGNPDLIGDSVTAIKLILNRFNVWTTAYTFLDIWYDARWEVWGLPTHGITDTQGRHLDGEFRGGVLPSGDGVEGGDFIANLLALP